MGGRVTMKRRGPSVTAAVLLLGVTLFLAALLTTCDSGLNAGLEAKEEQDDPNGPTVPGTGLSVDRQLAEALEVSWDAASDRTTAASELEYLLVYSSSDNIDSVADAEGNGSVAVAWSAATLDGEITGLTYGTDYYVNVLVRDGSGRKGAYGTVATATSDDGDAPTPGGAISVDTVDMEEISISWPAATDPDNLTAQADLEYKVVYSDGAAIDTATAAQANGTVSLDWTTAATSHTITGLIDDWTYSITVLVRDEVENTEVYAAVEETTVKHGRVFIGDTSTDAIYSCELDGSLLVTILDSEHVTNLQAIAVDDDRREIYWIDIVTSPSVTNVIKRSGFDGSNPTVFIEFGGIVSAVGIDVDSTGEYLYWTDITNDRIYRAPLDTDTGEASSHVLLDSSDGVVDPYGIDVDEATGDFYWAERTPPRIRYASREFPETISDFVTNSYIPDFSPDLENPWDVAVNTDIETAVYWCDDGANNQRIRAKSTGGGSAVLDLVTTGLSQPWNIDSTENLDEELLVYWIDNITNRIYRGSSFLTTNTSDYLIPPASLGEPRAIAVY